MCGFAVTLHRHRQVDTKALAEALRRLQHRGPDATGIETVRLASPGGQPLAEVGLAHARLAILDLDPRANQPYRSGDHWLVYNGEIYNHRALSAGFRLSTSGDTEVMLKLLMKDGLSGLAEANGMWSFCWLDATNGRLVAGRDRYGKKPLFYVFDGDALHLASEPDALAALTGRRLALRSTAVDRFMADGWLFPDPTGETHLDGIREVPPGHALTLDLRTWMLQIFHAFPVPEAEPSDAMDDRALASMLGDAVEARLISDRKVGLFLSGGVDSSLILSILHARGLADNVVCMTGDAGKSDDASYAEACIRQLGIEAVRAPLDYGKDGLRQFLDVCRAQAKPFPLIGNVLGMPALYAAAAERDIPVVLDGSGADEIFGGYWYRYFGFAHRDAAGAGDPAWLAGVQPAMPKSFTGLEEIAGWMPRREGMGGAQLALLRRDTRERIAATPPHDPLLGFGGTLAQALRQDATAGRMQEWLWQNDRNAMAAGIENRSPFLDMRLARWMTAPYADKFDGPWNKVALRRMFAHFTPLPTAQRRDKQGFRWSYSRFFGHNLEPVLDMIRNSSTVSALIETGAFVDAIRKGAVLPDSPLLHRLTVLAGLEASGLGLAQSLGTTP